MPVSPMIEITYCRLCGWGLRAGWMAQELLTTFAEELGSVTLTPDRTGGVFEVRIDDELTGRGRSGAAFRKSRRSNSSSATASPPVARSGIRTPP
jgi:selenoprotein W-related protein